MADETIRIDLLISTAESAGNLRDLKKAIKDVESELGAVAEGSEDFAKLSAAAGQARDKVNDLKDAVKAQSGAPIENLTNSFGMLKGSLTNLNFTDASNQLKGFTSNLKNVNVGSLTQGLKGFTSGLLDMGKALLANPIFLLVGVIAAIVYAISEWNAAEEESRNRVTKYNQEKLESLQGYLAYEERVAVAVGSNEKELHEVRMKNHQELLDSYQEEYNRLLERDDLSEEELETFKKIGKDLIKIKQDLRIEELSYSTKTRKDKEKADKEASDKAIKLAEEESKKAKSAADERKRTREKEWQEQLKIIDDGIKAAQDKYKADTEAFIAEEKRKSDAARQRSEDNINLIVENEALAASLTQGKLDDEAARYQQELMAFQIQRDEKGAITEASNEHLRLLEEQHQANITEIDRQANLDRAEASLAIAEKSTAALQGLSDLVFSIKKANTKKGSAEEEAAARKQFKVNKALAIAGAIIGGAQAAVKSLAQAPLAIGPIPSPIGIASLAAVVLTTAASVAKIAATQFDSGGSAGGGSTPSLGGGGSASGGEAPAAQAFVPPALQKITNDANKDKGAGTEPIKAYVVSQEISGAQDKSAVIDRRASF